MATALVQEKLLTEAERKATFTVKPEFADFENTVFASLGDGEKCKKVFEEVYREFSFDFNNPKFKKYVKVITDAVCNGFKVKKQDNGMLVTSTPVSDVIVKKSVSIYRKRWNRRIGFRKLKHFTELKWIKVFMRITGWQKTSTITRSWGSVFRRTHITYA